MSIALRVCLPLLVLAAGLIAACGGDDGPRRTGVATVDGVIDKVEAGDREELRELIQFQSLPCGDTAVGMPRCEDAEAPGTNVDVFQAYECEARWLRRDGMEPLLDTLIALAPDLYAAFETPEVFFLEGGYTAVFEGDDPREQGQKRYAAMGVEADNGLITGIAFGCGIQEPVHFLLPHTDNGFDDYIVAPRD